MFSSNSTWRFWRKDTEEKARKEANRAALSLFENAEYAKAEEILCTVLKAEESSPEDENLHTLTTQYNLVACFFAQKKWQDAERMLRLLLVVHERYKLMLRPNHPDTENIRSCLGECLVAQGKPLKEEIMRRSSRARYERVLEKSDFRLLTGDIWDWEWQIISHCP